MICTADTRPVKACLRSCSPSSPFWKKPWKRSFLGFGAERVYPWACMGCGVVLFYLDRLPAVAEEFRSLRNVERAREGQPAPLKP